MDAGGIDPAEVGWYRDKESGATAKRPEVGGPRADMLHGTVKTVVIGKVRRLGRRLKGGAATLADRPQENLRIVVATQKLGFDGSTDPVSAAWLLGLAETENGYRKGDKQRRRAGKEAERVQQPGQRALGASPVVGSNSVTGS